MTLTVDTISLIGLLAAVNLLYVGVLTQWGEGGSRLANRLFSMIAYVGTWWCFWLAINPAGVVEIDPRFAYMSQLFSGFFGPLLFLFTLAYTGVIERWRARYVWVLLPGAFGTVGMILWLAMPFPDTVMEEMRRMALAYYAGEGAYDSALISAHAPWFGPTQTGHMVQLFVFVLASIGVFLWKGLTLAKGRMRTDAWALAAVYLSMFVGTTFTTLMPTLGYGIVWIRVAGILPFPFILIVWMFLWRRNQVLAKLAKEREAMLAYLPVSSVDQMLEAGEAGRQGKKLDAAVLFADLRSFTALSEQVMPDRLVAWIDRFFDTMSEEILAEDGMVDKLIGDAILCVFGVPNEVENPAENALRASFRMQDALGRLNETYPISPGLETRMGIGIHYGPVIAGSVGGRRRTYTVFGDTVNTAHRIEGMNRELDTSILVSQAVFERLSEESRAALTPFDEVKLKGKRQRVRVYGKPQAAPRGRDTDRSTWA